MMNTRKFLPQLQRDYEELRKNNIPDFRQKYEHRQFFKRCFREDYFEYFNHSQPERLSKKTRKGSDSLNSMGT